MPDFYATLGVRRGAKPETIKKAYRKLSLRHHPDRGGDRAAFEQLHLAYEVLSDPARRRHYDATGEAGADPRIDNSLAAVAEVVAPVLQQLVLHFVKQNMRSGEHDLAKMVREGVQQVRANVHGELQTNKRAAEVLAEAVGRFEQTGEVNLLRAVAEQHLRAARASVATLTEALARFDRAIVYLKKAKYRHTAKRQQAVFYQMFTGSSTA